MTLGNVCDLLMRARVYTDWTLERVHRQFSHPMAHGQAIIFAKEDRPVGVVTWAFVSDEVLLELMQGKRGVAPHAPFVQEITIPHIQHVLSRGDTSVRARLCLKCLETCPAPCASSPVRLRKEQ